MTSSRRALTRRARTTALVASERGCGFILALGLPVYPDRPTV